MSAILDIRGAQHVALSITEEALALKASALNNAGAISEVGNKESLDRAAAVVSEIKGILKKLETSRTEIKRPVLDLGKRIDTVAQEYATELVLQANRLQASISAYYRAEAEKTEAQRKMLEALAEKRRLKAEAEARAAEEERRQLEAEARAEANREKAAALEAEARAEASREKAAALEAEARAEANREKAAALEAEARAEASREKAAALEAEARAEASREKAAALAKEAAERQAEADAARLKAEASAPPAPVAAPARAEKMSVRKVWKHKVTNIHQVYQHKPELVNLEPRTNAILAEIRAGMTECPGLEIWAEEEVIIRS
jgi:membrane protein involved in colicin uptake